MMKKIEAIFEGMLWRSRYIVLSAVISSLLAGLAMFFIATVDAAYMVSHLFEYALPSLASDAREELRAATITHVVEIVDGYLLATVLLIFALGLYELFISKIDMAIDTETSSRVLIINNLDDLKSRLGKVILMILIVKFFEHAINMEFKTAMDLLLLSGGIAAIGLALYLSHKSDEQN